MGIKGLYPELGPTKRESLAKLTAESFRQSSRPLRIAVDIAIWQYQNQAAQGGVNPAIRTLFYRLARLKATPVQAIFVFDGPHKPPFKRKKRSGRGNSIADAQAKRLIRLFGFPVHDAPGEAEAECALMQKQGIVDAVLSEDIDTVMFGCTMALRNWSAENGTSPTHVTVHDAHRRAGASDRLSREGMVLVALMSGGDYLPDGIPGCGVKVACEAAKAGFGETICRLKGSDKPGLATWRERLVHELRTNESKHFRTKHPALTIPDDFPNLEVLRYYTHPVVSPLSVLDAARQKLGKKEAIQLEGLREFTREEFGWDFRVGAFKFVRVIGAALLSDAMQNGQAEEKDHVKRISGRRTHFSADAEPELRVAYVPSEVVPIDMSKEVDEEISYSRDGLALNSDEEVEEAPDNAISSSQSKSFDPTKQDLVWVLEEFASRTISSAVTTWKTAELARSVQKSPKKKRATGPRSLKNTGMPEGALHAHFKTGKPTSSTAVSKEPVTSTRTAMPKSVSPEKSRDAPQDAPIPASVRQKPSKIPNPSLDENHPARFDEIYDSPMTHRSRKCATEPETILISSSPICAAPLSPASSLPGPRACSPSREDVFDDVRPGNFKAPTSQSMKGRQTVTKNTATKIPHVSADPPSKLQQTSIKMFATRLGTSSAPLAKSDGDEDDLPPISSLLSLPHEPTTSPASPTKRLNSPVGSKKEASPTRTGSTQKKLFVPSSNGYMREITVEASERDAVEAKEMARLAAIGRTQRPIRLSDMSVIDLTEGIA